MSVLFFPAGWKPPKEWHEGLIETIEDLTSQNASRGPSEPPHTIHALPVCEDMADDLVRVVARGLEEGEMLLLVPIVSLGVSQPSPPLYQEDLDRHLPPEHQPLYGAVDPQAHIRIVPLVYTETNTADASSFDKYKEEKPDWLDATVHVVVAEGRVGNGVVPDTQGVAADLSLLSAASKKGEHALDILRNLNSDVLPVVVKQYAVLEGDEEERAATIARALLRAYPARWEGDGAKGAEISKGLDTALDTLLKGRVDRCAPVESVAWPDNADDLCGLSLQWPAGTKSGVLHGQVLEGLQRVHRVDPGISPGSAEASDDTPTAVSRMANRASESAPSGPEAGPADDGRGQEASSLGSDSQQDSSLHEARLRSLEIIGQYISEDTETSSRDLGEPEAPFGVIERGFSRLDRVIATARRKLGVCEPLRQDELSALTKRALGWQEKWEKEERELLREVNVFPSQTSVALEATSSGLAVAMTSLAVFLTVWAIDDAMDGWRVGFSFLATGVSLYLLRRLKIAAVFLVCLLAGGIVAALVSGVPIVVLGLSAAAMGAAATLWLWLDHRSAGQALRDKWNAMLDRWRSQVDEVERALQERVAYSLRRAASREGLDTLRRLETTQERVHTELLAFRTYLDIKAERRSGPTVDDIPAVEVARGLWRLVVRQVGLEASQGIPGRVELRQYDQLFGGIRSPQCDGLHRERIDKEFAEDMPEAHEYAVMYTGSGFYWPELPDESTARHRSETSPVLAPFRSVMWIYDPLAFDGP